MTFSAWKRPVTAMTITLLLGIGASGCSSDGSDNDIDANRGGNDSGRLSALTDSQINAPDGQLQATIRTTTGGVPHIMADNLESAGFGEGYVQARDNVCLIADAIVRARGERAAYYGPGPDLSDSVAIGINIVKDFSYKALRLRAKADAQFDQLSDVSAAMLRGFAAGYNKYVDDTAPEDLPGKCAPPASGMPGKSPVVKITPQDIYAYYQLVALYASGENFTEGPTFFAAPPEANPAPVQTRPLASGDTRFETVDAAVFARNARPADLGLKTDFNDRDMGSNGWGIGSEMTENGRGALLANPHFPYTGARRLYQSQITVPGVYNVNGAALIGIVIPLIGFNDNVAWTHTVSTAQHFTFYQLQLADGDDMSYIKDGASKSITKRTFTVDVANGTPNPTTLQKTFYYSDQGLMIAGNLINANLPAWGGSFPGQDQPVAFTYRDANAEAGRQVLDQWIGMGRAQNLAQFKKPFESCGTTLWVNTMYADSSGQAFYIDGTSVPNLSAATLSALTERIARNPIAAGLFNAGVTLLDGSTSRDDWVEGRCNGRVAYNSLPRLARRDYVQNSNDSYWATNPEAVLTGFSPLFGPTESILTPRTRMGLRMLENPADGGLSSLAPAGSDGKFTGNEIINNALYSNRAYYAETLLDDLLARCEAAGDTAINVDTDDSRSVAGGCAALTNWNGVYNTDSVGAHVFRVFIADYSPGFPDEFTVAFDPAKPETTPSTPKAAPANVSEDPMLQSLARGLNALDQVDIDYDASLGEVQAEQQSAGVPPADFPGLPSQAAPSGPLIPWHGTQNIEGGFNIVEPVFSGVDEGTRFPRVTPTGPLPDTGGLSATPGEGWRIARGTSWHFGMNFSDDGPRGFGLVSYSQSDDPSSDHFSDQDRRYSDKNVRALLFSEADIANDPNFETETISAQTDTDSGAGSDSMTDN